jgi:Icc protein
MTRLLVLSDLHLRAAEAARVRGVKTRAALDAALEHARREGPFERVILCGDLAEDARPESYAALRERLPDALVLPGNHDRRGPLAGAFPSRPETPHGGFVDEVAGVRLIGLDSLWEGRIRGRLGAAQLAWLEAALAADERPAILFVHHPPVRVDTVWLDGSRLADAGALAAVMARSGRVRLVVHGHVHMPNEGELGGARVVGVPSTAFEFIPRTLLPQRGPARPGYRIVDLAQGEIATSVRWVEE